MSVSIGIKVNPLRSIMSLPPFGNPFNSPLTGSPVIEHHSPLRKQKQDQQYPCVPPHPLQTSLLRCGRSFPGLSKADIVTSPLSAIPSQSQDLLFNSSFHSPDCVCVCVSLCQIFLSVHTSPPYKPLAYCHLCLACCPSQITDLVPSYLSCIRSHPLPQETFPSSHF